MKLDLNKKLVGLDGVETEGTTIGKLVAQYLASSNKGDSLKIMDMAQKLYNDKPLDLDPSDTEFLKNFIKENESFTNLLKAQALRLFKE